MRVAGRVVFAVSVLVIAAAGCAASSGSEAADCGAVRVAFEDTLGHVRGTGVGTVADDADVDVGAAALRDAVSLHDARQECFGAQHGEFVDPAREDFAAQQFDALPQVEDGHGPVLGEPRSAAGD